LTWQRAEVVAIRDETRTVRTLAFLRPELFEFLPGQHVDIRLTAEDGYQAQRSYSIASAPEDEFLELTVERLDDGEVSPFLVDELRVGDLIEVRGPIGEYFVWTSAHGGPLLLIAGGSGIVPFRSMLRHHAATKSDAKVRVIHSSRSLDTIIYHDELTKLESTGLVTIHHTLTRERSAEWTGRRRRLDEATIAELAWVTAERPLVFVCGPTSFVESIADSLVRLGHDALRIRTERFGPTGG
jgi:ferredoxin-NADP reductase